MEFEILGLLNPDFHGRAWFIRHHCPAKLMSQQARQDLLASVARHLRTPMNQITNPNVTQSLCGEGRIRCRLTFLARPMPVFQDHCLLAHACYRCLLCLAEANMVIRRHLQHVNQELSLCHQTTYLIYRARHGSCLTVPPVFFSLPEF